MKEEVIQIEASTGDEKLSLGTATIHKFAQNEKTLRAFKRMGLFWLIAVFCVFLPVVHFVLVPLFLVIGIFMFFRVMKTDGEVLSGAVSCPTCGASVVIGKDFLNWPLKEICQGCTRVLRIYPKENP